MLLLSPLKLLPLLPRGWVLLGRLSLAATTVWMFLCKRLLSGRNYALLLLWMLWLLDRGTDDGWPHPRCCDSICRRTRPAPLRFRGIRCTFWNGWSCSEWMPSFLC